MEICEMTGYYQASERLVKISYALNERNMKQSPDSNSWAYTAGYLESTLARALDMLPAETREKFLSDLEKTVIRSA